MKVIFLLLRWLLAFVFLFSGYSKLVTLDHFEVYVYSFGVLSFDVAAWFARILISIEFVLGFGLLLRYRYGLIWKLSMLSLLIFSMILVLSISAGENSNCFCFGALLDISPLESLSKNVVLILLLLFIRKGKERQAKFTRMSFFVLLIVAVALPLIYTPPDNLIPGRISQAEMDQQALDLAFESGHLPTSLKEGKNLLCFYSTGCKFCQLASERISTAVIRQNIDENKIHLAFLDTPENEIKSFLESTHSIEAEVSHLKSGMFLSITKGRMPLIVMMNEGEIEFLWTYRQIDEKLLSDYLKQ